MGFFTAVDKEAKSLASKVEAAFSKLFQEEPKVEQIVVSVISAVAPTVVAITAATGNEAESAAIAGIVSIVKSDLAAVQVTLNEAGAGTGDVSVKSIFTSINTNLATLLSAGYIKDPATLAKVTSDVTKIETALNVLISAL